MIHCFGLISLIAVPGVRNGFLRQRATVLMYHDLCRDEVDVEAWTIVRRADFLRQVDYLRRHYELVSLDDALGLLKDDGPRARPLAVLTFDDGLAGNFDILLPIIEHECIPVTIYVATSHIEDGRSYWFDRVVNALQTVQPVELDLAQFALGRYRINDARGAGNWAQIQRLLSDLKQLPADGQSAVVDHIEVAAAAIPRAVGAPLRPLSLESMRRLAANRFVTIGAHSHCHTLLTRLPLEQATASIQRSRTLLQQWTGQPVEHFAYPSGAFDDALAQAVGDLGFRTAVTTENGFWSKDTSLMKIPRIAVGRYDDSVAFRVNLLGGLRDFARLALH